MSASLTLHASLVQLNQTGVLLLGPSGSGKSELCLHLLERGHQLVSDDAVTLSVENTALTGQPSTPLLQSIHLRALGLLNPVHHFGLQAVIPRSTISLAIQLIEHYPKDMPTSLSLPNTSITFLNYTIPLLYLPTLSAVPAAIRLESYVKHFTLMTSTTK